MLVFPIDPIADCLEPTFHPLQPESGRARNQHCCHVQVSMMHYLPSLCIAATKEDAQIPLVDSRGTTAVLYKS